MGPEIKPTEDKFKEIDIKMNHAKSQEHVPEIYRAIRKIKEIPRAYINDIHITFSQK